MLARRIIPCLDVDKGRVVKGVRFVDLRAAGDPVELASRYDAEGADELVFLDISASHEKRELLYDAASRTAESVFIPLTIGGAVRTAQDVQRLLRAGADKVAVNTAAVARPELISEAAGDFGAQALVVAIDAARREGMTPPSWEVFVQGGRKATGWDAVQWARKACELGAGEILITSMDRDGTGEGYDIELTRAVSDAVGVPVIASGGAGSPEHMADVLDPARGAADAALAASVFHFGHFSIRDAKLALEARGLPVRIPQP